METTEGRNAVKKTELGVKPELAVALRAAEARNGTQAEDLGHALFSLAAALRGSRELQQALDAYLGLRVATTWISARRLTQ